MPLLVALVLVSALLIVLQMLSLNDVLFGAGFHPAGVLRVASYLAPHFGIIAVPLSFLLAVMLGLGRMSEDNELVALASLGRSPLSLYPVPILYSAALGIIVAQIAFVGEPWGLRGIHRQLNELNKRNVAADIHPNAFSEDIPRFTIYVGATSHNGAQWDRVFLHDSVGDGAPLLMLAQHGQVQSQGADSVLRLDLTDGELHRIGTDDGYARITFERGTVALGVESFLARKNMFNRPAGELRLWEMPPAIAAAHEAGDEVAARRLQSQYYGRIASPFTCLIFGLIGIPLIALGRSSRSASFGTTLFAFVGYYVLQTLGNGLGETGRAPALVGAWLPNAVGLLVAVVLAWRLRGGMGAGPRA